MRKMRKRGFLGLLGFAVLLLVGAACASDPEVIEVIKEVVVEKEVIKEVKVAGETIIVEKEVVKEVEVKGETVIH